jgi:hypothetical protein
MTSTTFKRQCYEPRIKLSSQIIVSWDRVKPQGERDPYPGNPLPKHRTGYAIRRSH